MGASSSTEQISPEQREAESLAASTGALSALEKAFSTLSDPETKTIPITSLKVTTLSLSFPIPDVIQESIMYVSVLCLQ
ncbi:hypothetical protein Hanom_Chr15g01409181 [Helianthus anomalus]